jgi:hypothetical protein
VNSAIAKPDHDETLTISKRSESDDFYTVRGYAYGGGGRRVTRVELSLDEGITWSLAAMYEIIRFQYRFAYSLMDAANTPRISSANYVTWTRSTELST